MFVDIINLSPYLPSSSQKFFFLCHYLVFLHATCLDFIYVLRNIVNFLQPLFIFPLHNVPSWNAFFSFLLFLRVCFVDVNHIWILLHHMWQLRKVIITQIKQMIGLHLIWNLLFLLKGSINFSDLMQDMPSLSMYLISSIIIVWSSFFAMNFAQFVKPMIFLKKCENNLRLCTF